MPTICYRGTIARNLSVSEAQRQLQTGAVFESVQPVWTIGGVTYTHRMAQASDAVPETTVLILADGVVQTLRKQKVFRERSAAEPEARAFSIKRSA